MNTMQYLLALVLTASVILAQPVDLGFMDEDQREDMSLEFVDQFQEAMTGSLISSDFLYFYFYSPLDEANHLVPRAEVKYLETNTDIDLRTVLSSEDPSSLMDVIELNDGSKIPSIILDVGAEYVQYFAGKKMKRELISTKDIYMLYIDNAKITIPFPVDQLANLTL